MSLRQQRRRNWLRLGLQIGGVLLLAGLPAAPARAECLSLKSGAVVYDVAGCVLVNPEKTFDVTKEKYSWIAGLDAAGRKKFLDSYRGLYLKGKVVKSAVTEPGVSGEAGVLTGETVFMYIPPGAYPSCNEVLGKRVSGTLREICCDGGGDVPCLLDTSYGLLQPKVIGSVSSGAGDQARQKAKASKDYAEGDKAFRAKNYKVAAKAYQKARVNDELDIKGYYKLGYAYRELDQCGDAVAPLKHVQEEREKNAIWADEDKIARAAIFLLARCYSKMNRPSSATMILNSYLLEPERYKAELRDSLTHRDFGWIHTSKEYLDYKKEAQKKTRAQ